MKELVFGVKQWVMAPSSPNLLPGLGHLPGGRATLAHVPMVAQHRGCAGPGSQDTIQMCISAFPNASCSHWTEVTAKGHPGPSGCGDGRQPCNTTLLKKHQDVPMGICFPWDIHARTWLGCN